MKAHTLARWTALLWLCGCSASTNTPSDSAPKDSTDQDTSSDSTQSTQDPDPDPSGDAGPANVYKPCEAKLRWGQLAVRLEPKFSAVQGSVANGVVPDQIMELVNTQGECSLYKPPVLSCDPPCGPSERCNAKGECIPVPRAQDAGTITLKGLAQALTLTPRPPNQFYAHEGTLVHPVVTANDTVQLFAAGEQTPAFRMHAYGIDMLTGAPETLQLEKDKALKVSWDIPSKTGQSKVLLDLNVNNHGAAASKISCLVEDNGSYSIPAALIQELRDAGVSGFPSITLRRQSVDSASIEQGCVELVVQSEQVIDLEIPGLVSCNDDSDCPDGQSCQADLTCG